MEINVWLSFSWSALSMQALTQSGCFSAGKKAAYLIRLLKDNGDNVQLVTKSNVKT